jgi:hypothetical membrane protein
MKWNVIAVLYIILLIIIAQIIVPDSYDWVQHSISQYAAQNYEYQWIMQLGFLGFGVLLSIGVFTNWAKNRKYWYREVPVLVYALSIAVSALFSTDPFIEGVSYSEQEAQLHSFFATLAGFSFSITVLLYTLTEQIVWKKSAHFLVLWLVIGLSFGIYTTENYVGLLQRLLWAVSFTWLVFLYNPRVD